MHRSTFPNNESLNPLLDYPGGKKRTGKEPAPAEYKRPPPPPPYDTAATYKWIEHVRYDPWWRSQMPVSYRTLSLLLGYPDRYFATMMSGKPGISPTQVIAKLGRLIPDIECRKIGFPKTKLLWPKKEE